MKNIKLGINQIFSNQRWVLTAAHCLVPAHTDPNSLRIMVGSAFVRRLGTMIEIEKIINHSEYDRPTLNNE